MEIDTPFLKTGRISSPRELGDGVRISVMSRHTLPDGITPDARITPKMYDVWMKELAPPDVLIGAYYKRGLPWNEFKRLYREFLQKPETNVYLQRLIFMAKAQTLTLLCIEESPEQCHRRLLAQFCRELDHDIRILIR